METNVDRFCGTYGENVSGKTSIDDNEKKDIKTFDDYMLLNSKKKKGFQPRRR